MIQRYIVKIAYSEFHEDMVAHDLLHAESGVAEMLVGREAAGQGQGSIGDANNMELYNHNSQ